VKLVASNALDEKKMADMETYEGARFDSYGVGENLITSSSDPVMGGVYKLVAVKEKDGTYSARMKTSDSSSKAIIPGKLMAWRVFDEDGQGQCDIIGLDNENIEAGREIVIYDLNPDAFHKSRKIKPLKVEKILVPFLENGELVTKMPTIQEKKAYIKDQIENKVWESELRPEMPHRHYVDLTENLYNLREEMYEKLHGGRI